MKRQVLHVVHAGADGRWHLNREGGSNEGSFDTKQSAVEAGRSRAKDVHTRGGLAQLVVHREDGSFETEYTYGDDPRRTPG